MIFLIYTVIEHFAYVENLALKRICGAVVIGLYCASFIYPSHHKTVTKLCFQ